MLSFFGGGLYKNFKCGHSGLSRVHLPPHDCKIPHVFCNGCLSVRGVKLSEVWKYSMCVGNGAGTVGVEDGFVRWQVRYICIKAVILTRDKKHLHQPNPHNRNLTGLRSKSRDSGAQWDINAVGLMLPFSLFDRRLLQRKDGRCVLLPELRNRLVWRQLQTFRTCGGVLQHCQSCKYILIICMYISYI